VGVKRYIVEAHMTRIPTRCWVVQMEPTRWTLAEFYGEDGLKAANTIAELLNEHAKEGTGLPDRWGAHLTT
jgi:hypothetical protein